jgi:uncharacterized protein
MDTNSRQKTVLITGATSGIGYEFASIFAQDGYNLVLVARSEASLFEVAARMKKAGSPNVTVIPCDLSVAGSARHVFDETTSQGIEVNILVNNAGMGEHGFFHETDLEKELSIIQLNAATVVELTKLYLNRMMLRNEGRILQVASAASYQHAPKLAVYGATKAFMLSFSDAIINELRKSNITMTVLLPGPTDTDFFNKAGMENTIDEKAVLDDPGRVAQIGYEALMTGEHHAYCPPVRRQVALDSVIINETVAAMARKQMEEFKQ